MGFSHLPGTPEPLPSPYPVAILCNGQSCLGSPALCSREHRRLDAYLFSPFQGILFIPAYLCSCCSLHQNTLLGPIYQPEVIWSGREVWVWVSALHLAVWTWANCLTSLSLSFPLVSITGSCEGSDETKYILCLFKKYIHVDSLPLIHSPRPSSVQVYLCSTFTGYLRPYTYFSHLIPFIIIICIR